LDDVYPEARTTTIMTRCPECEADLELDGYDLDVGETTSCPECSIELKVVSVDPVALRLMGDDED
jgi:lysine biosynthesis protein LysW